MRGAISTKPSFSVERDEPVAGSVVLRLAGALDVHVAPRALARIRELLEKPARSVRLDLAGVESLDGAAAALLLALCERLHARGVEAELVGAAGRAGEILQLVASSPPGIEAQVANATPGLFEQVGRETSQLWVSARQILDFTGNTAVAFGRALADPRSIPWRSVWRVMERSGADALPIIAMLTFLVGLVTAFQGAITLHKYGADIFVADGVAIAVTRELGPLMVAVIAAGRSGASFAAELGTMRVSEEVDALRTIGLDPYRYLVLPRVLALTAMLPVLTLLGDACAIAGGTVVGVGSLDVPFTAWARQSRNALDVWYVCSGLLKSVAFGLAIGLVACQAGLATRGGAEGVGRSTTSAVVTSLFFLVVIDSAFTVLYHVWDL